MNAVIKKFPNEKPSLHDQILIKLGGMKATNLEININEVMDLIDINSDYHKVRDWLLNEKIITKSEWNKSLNIKIIKDELGDYPTTAMRYLELWVEKHGLSVNYKKDIIKNESIYYDGINVNLEIIKLKAEIENNPSEQLYERLRLFEEIHDTMSTYSNILDLSRDMRIKSKELGLGFSKHDIDDVINAWMEKQKPARKYEIFSKISFRKECVTEAKNEWNKLIKSSFDINVMNDEVIEAVLRKFIWQVKRKIQKLPVTRHLMPVLLGPQGTGKTTFINMFTECIAEMRAQVDFNQITDNGAIDIWENFVLIFDEMGYATKADIESVKNYITTNTITRRFYYTNNTGNIRQNATFIGASNKELDQLIRDETGLRRFIGLRYSNSPNWDILNKINFVLLWQSVDERGEDPILPFLDYIQNYQEESREISLCEEWAKSLTPCQKKLKFNDNQTLYRNLFHTWQETYSPNKKMDYTEWRKEMNRLVNNDPLFPFVKVKHGVSTYFKFKL